MNDFLLTNDSARKVIKALGLPLPVPPKLLRAEGPMKARPLHDEYVAVGCSPSAAMAQPLAQTLTRAGASCVVTHAQLVPAFKGPGEAYGRPAVHVDVDDYPADKRARALVFDATGVSNPSELRSLYNFFHPLIPQLQRNGRVVILGRPPRTRAHVETAAAQAALEGFVRSIAKELGRRGSTAQLLYVEDGAQSRVEGPLRFFLSQRSAFVSGQPLEVTVRVASAGEIAWTRPLEGKTALVTGAARGIGAATARMLAAEGATVVCLDRPADETLCTKVANEIGGATLLADVSSKDAPDSIARGLNDRFGGVDVVVHNAGVTGDKTLARMKPEKWDQTIDTNLSAVVRITDALLAGPMRDGGRIILLSSVAGIAGNMGQTNYAASKSGIIGYTEQLARAVAERGITANAIAPGFIETRLTAAIPVMIREVARRLSNLSQGGLPRDVGDAITFLSTPGSLGISGQVLRVCGGALVGA